MARLLLILLVLAVAGALVWWRRRPRAVRAEPPGNPAPASVAPARTDSPPAPRLPTAAPQPSSGDPHALPDTLAQLRALALGDARAADPALQPEAVHQGVLLESSHEIARIGSTPRYTPRQPSLLPQVMTVLDDEDASMRALSRVIAQDPELTSELLRTANSALYRVGDMPVESLERACALIGTRGLRTLITTALVKPLAAGSTDMASRFGKLSWEHALYSASAGEAWAARQQDCDPYTVHLLGLLHGLGSMVVYRILMDQYRLHADLAPDAVALSQALDTQSGIAAARIAASWGLSSRTCAALESQSGAAPAHAHGPLGEALRFGRMAGALILLCHHDRLTLAQSQARLAAAGYHTPTAQRVWERMVKAYVDAH